MLTSAQGIVTTTNAALLLVGPAAIRRIHLYNPNSSASSFVLRKIVTDIDGVELIIRQWDDSMPATDSWGYGSLGGSMILVAEQRLELKLDSSPTLPIEWTIDYHMDLS